MKGKMYKFAMAITLMILVAFGIPMALSADAQIPRKESGLQSYPVEATTQIYKGGFVCLNTSGYPRHRR